MSRDTLKASPASAGAGRFVVYRSPGEDLMGLELEPGKVHRFVDYNEFEAAPTAVPGSSRRTRLPAALVSKYYFGDRAVLERAPPVPAKHRSHEYHFILDNGGWPFLLYRSGSDPATVHVYARDEGAHVPGELWARTGRAGRRGFYQALVKRWTAREVLPGKSERKGDAGNAVLLRLGGGRYAYVGSEIYEFRPDDAKDPITEFYSAVASSGVPYPVALSRERAYLLGVRASTERAGPTTRSRRDKLRAHEEYYARHYGGGTRKLKGFKLVRARRDD
eukprot:jgi/Tetstr1/463950/TSEL_008755.t1